MSDDYNIVYDRNPKDMLSYIDKRIVDAFGLYEYKPTQRAEVAYLGVSDRDLALYISNFKYKIRATLYDALGKKMAIEFSVKKKDWWKIRKIIFKFMRNRRWQKHVSSLLGSDWKKWAFVIKP